MEYAGTPLTGMRLADSTGAAGVGCMARLAGLGATIVPLHSASDYRAATVLLANVDAWIFAHPTLPRLSLQGAARRARRHHRQRIDVALHFGTTRSAPTSDLLLQAAGGMLFLNGDVDAYPLPGAGRPAFDCLAASIALALLLARRQTTQTRHGARLRVHSRAAVAAAIEHLGSMYFDAGCVPRRSGGHWSGNFRHVATRDGHVLITTQCDHDILADWLAAEGVVADDLRQSPPSAWFDAMTPWAASQSAGDLEQRALERGLPFHRLATPADLAHHPQLRARRPEVVVLPARHLPACPPASVRRSTQDSHAPLAGVRVLDFSWVVAGPLATRVLADAGAEVVRIDPPQHRHDPPTVSGIPARLQRDKRSIAIDMTLAEGREIALALAGRADVLLANFRPRVFEQWGFSEGHLRTLHPELITLCMSAFGATGPWSNVPGFAPTLHAAAGYDSSMAGTNGHPYGWGFSYSDMSSGVAAATAVVAALLRRDATGKGAFVDLAQFDHLTRLLTPARSEHGAESAIFRGVYRCADEAHRRCSERWIAIEGIDTRTKQGLRQLLGIPPAQPMRGGTPAFPDVALAAWIRARAATDVVSRLRRLGIPAVIVSDAEDLCSHGSPAYLHGYWRRLGTATGSSHPLETLPFCINGGAVRPHRRAPQPGEHSRSVLHDWLRLDSTTVEALHRSGAVASATPSDQE